MTITDDEIAILEVSYWRGRNWSPWEEAAQGTKRTMTDIANKEAKRLAYNFRARVIVVLEEINT